MKVLFLGMDGVFSYPPLAAIIKAMRSGQNSLLEVVGVVLPASAVPNIELDGVVKLRPPERPQTELPLVQPYLSENIIHLAWANDIPVYLVQGMKEKEVNSFFSDLEPDVACVACFPYRIPAAILAIPKLGFLNLHPSLLPEYRGPSPLFWIFRNGDNQNAGVTLHWMDEGMDSGDILSQRTIALPDGIRGLEADRLCASVGGEMLLEELEKVVRGRGRRRPQPPGGSYQPQPTAHDFTIDRQWSARHAFNFMRGTAHWNYPFTLEIGSQTILLTNAESYDPNRILSEPFLEHNGLYYIQFSPGVLTAH